MNVTLDMLLQLARVVMKQVERKVKSEDDKSLSASTNRGVFLSSSSKSAAFAVPPRKSSTGKRGPVHRSTLSDAEAAKAANQGNDPSRRATSLLPLLLLLDFSQASLQASLTHFLDSSLTNIEFHTLKCLLNLKSFSIY